MKKLSFFLFLCLGLGNQILAQMPNDHVYMAKKDICAALIYSNTSWNKYWENTLFRDNLNLGTVSTESYMLMAAYGLTDHSNLIASLPYVQTKASAGNLMGQKGMQDAGLWLKHRITISRSFKSHVVAGLTVPVSNYVSEFMPLSIGNKATDFQMRGMLTYQIPNTKLYANAVFAYHLRGISQLDRDSYLNGDKMINTSTADVPDAVEASFKLGYLKWDNQIELYVDHFACVAGDVIRRNDMPFPTNKTMMTSIGLYGKYQPKNLGVNARIQHVLQGTNTAQMTTYSVGLLYQFTLMK
ncbi:MAG: hypothetical protein RJA76_589 [Bacteroidota bacterium]|jgi:hypothetical protein